MNQDQFFLDLWAERENGQRLYPYKGERGDKKGLYSVNFTNDTNNFEGLTEERLIEAILAGRFSDRGTIRMLPLDFKPGAERNAYAPSHYKGRRLSRESDGNSTANTRSDESLNTANLCEEYPVDEITFRAVKSRRGQPEFRKSLLGAYSGRCCITKCDVENVLEAAHIVPHTEETNYFLSNGLLLRADVHTLFDLNIIGIDSSGIVCISKELKESEYWQYHGKCISTNISQAMSANLARRFEQYKINMLDSA